MPSLTIEEIEYHSAAGSKLAIEHGILYPPAVILEGRLVGKGKIDAQKMIATIREFNGASK